MTGDGARSTERLKQAADAFVLHALRSQAHLVFERAAGVRLWDIDGREYLDGLSGTQGVAMVGHGHPQVIEAVTKQWRELPDHFFSFDSVPLIEFCTKMAELAPGKLSKTHLTVGGGEAIEAALKLAMRVTGKTEVFSFHDAYHGMSLATMGLAGIAAFREWMPGSNRWLTFQQLPSGNAYRPRLSSDPEMNWRAAACGLEAAFTGASSGRVAAVVMELVQGPGGHVVFSPGYAQEVQRICRENDVLLIVDEIQTGLARCGARWACDLYGIEPDMLVIGKAFGGGMPFGGLVVGPELVSDELELTGWNVLTFMNQPLQAAAGSAVVEIVEQEGLIDRAEVLGQRARAHFGELAERLEVIGDVRGPGLFIGIDLVLDRETKEPATEVGAKAVTWALEHGLITGLGGRGKNVLKFKPPLIVSDEDFDRMLELMGQTLEFADREARARPLVAAS